MNTPKPYTPTEQCADMAAEPTAVRTLQNLDVTPQRCHHADDFVDNMPKEALRMASEYALRESHAGRGITHEQVMDMLKEKRGWR